MIRSRHLLLPLPAALAAAPATEPSFQISEVCSNADGMVRFVLWRDYIMPNQFLAAEGATLNFAGTDPFPSPRRA